MEERPEGKAARRERQELREGVGMVGRPHQGQDTGEERPRGNGEKIREN